MGLNKNTKLHWIKKFGSAFRGLYIALHEETSLVVHFIVGTITIILGIVLHKQMSPADWAIIVITIGIVIGMELINTAIENLVDVISFEYNYKAKKIKEVSAAATFVLTIVAFAVGLIIFIPKIINYV